MEPQLRDNFYAKGFPKDYEHLLKGMQTWAAGQGMDLLELASPQKAWSNFQNRKGQFDQFKASVAACKGWLGGLKLTFQTDGEVRLVRYSKALRQVEWLGWAAGLGGGALVLLQLVYRLWHAGLPEGQTAAALMTVLFLILLAPMLGVLAGIVAYFSGILVEGVAARLAGQTYAMEDLETAWMAIQGKSTNSK